MPFYRIINIERLAENIIGLANPWRIKSCKEAELICHQ